MVAVVMVTVVAVVMVMVAVVVVAVNTETDPEFTSTSFNTILLLSALTLNSSRDQYKSTFRRKKQQLRLWRLIIYYGTLTKTMINKNQLL
ncbi:hypothetical protein Ahia01_000643200, partial [Argonauta hians]